MRRLLITSFTIIALAMIYTGCGSGGSASSNTEQNEAPTSTQVGNSNENSPSNNADQTANNAQTTSQQESGTTADNINETTISNEYGLNPDLGTPPPVPAS